MSDTSDVETAATTLTDAPVEQAFTSSKRALSNDDEKKLEKKRRFRLAAVGASLVIAIGLAVGLSVALTRSSSNDDDNTGSLEDTPKEANDFVNPKSFMDYICSNESIADLQGFDLCKDACQPADCCDPYKASDSSSCLEEDLESCVSYAKCQGVMDTNVDPAPSNLTDICSIESLAKSKSECRKACQDVECCYSSHDSCVSSQFLTCLDYAPCQNLRNETILPVAPPNLDEVCALNKTDNEECEDLCKPAECCAGDFGLNGESDEKCLQSDFISCLTYAPCGDLMLPPLNSEVQQAPDTIAELCTVDNLLGDGYDACATACSGGDCCTQADGNCFHSDPLGCMEYAQCGLLKLTGGDIPRAPENLLDICSWENLQKDAETAAQCAEACNPASCCLGVDSTDTCVDDGNFFACAEYYPCTVLYIAGGGLKAPPETIRQDCSNERWELDDGLSCAVSCSEGDCCFSTDGDSCLYGNADKCVSYMHSGCWRVPGWLNFDPYKDGLP